MLATGGTERRLLQTVVENATWKCDVLQTKLFEHSKFCAIRTIRYA